MTVYFSMPISNSARSYTGRHSVLHSTFVLSLSVFQSILSHGLQGMHDKRSFSNSPTWLIHFTWYMILGCAFFHTPLSAFVHTSYIIAFQTVLLSILFQYIRMQRDMLFSRHSEQHITYIHLLAHFFRHFVRSTHVQPTSAHSSRLHLTFMRVSVGGSGQRVGFGKLLGTSCKEILGNSRMQLCLKRIVVKKFKQK